MAKKEGFDFKDIIYNAGFSLLKDGVTTLVHKMQEIIYMTQKKMEQSMMSMMLMTAGIIFICVGLIQLMNQYIPLAGGSYLIVGGFLFLIAVIMKLMSDKNKYYEVE
ncbi:hypothetical protein ACFLZN_01345 [Nanoarchaeota archaeon]